MSIYVQVVSVASDDSSPSLLLSTDKHKYMFNVGEGTQRLCTEHKLRVARVDRILLTEIKNESVGGLPGLILTVSDAEKEGLGLYGPPGTRRLIAASESFVSRPDFKLDIEECSVDSNALETVFDDGEISVYAFCIKPPPSCESDDDGKRPAKKSKTEEHGKNNEEMDVEVESGWDDDDSNHVCYICITKEVLGKFDVAKAKELGIPPGPIYGKLKSG
eukprot:CAMPEP_0206392696 /NCGR_PEP_ID=MMETSP0294-20121207/20150_1 /ASSEMBLY_ACC=CAM_ASM_000327 /TAXON_ID=39354 /ORGANISM="Heterosigma akashiwo, Strain CCMP2393" /LENGTH=217 /DNA_ID=CAMNT_0053845899 /DNA_START=62 /DNA_END=711 /DNA_ORIENTATION=+